MLNRFRRSTVHSLRLASGARKSFDVCGTLNASHTY